MSIELDKETVAYLKRLIKRGGHEGEQARNVLKAAGLLEANVIKEEERDSHGRWTSGGGGGGEGNSRAQHTPADHSAAAVDHSKKESEHFYEAKRAEHEGDVVREQQHKVASDAHSAARQANRDAATVSGGWGNAEQLQASARADALSAVANAASEIAMGTR